MIAPAEPAELRAARERLSRGEAGYRSVAGLHHLVQGFAMLEEVMARNIAGQRALACNMASTYCAKIVASIQQLLERDPAVPEPELEHLFKVVLALDETDVDLPAEARAVKIEIARRLIDCYYEGYSPEQKQAAIEQLTAVSDRKRRRTRR